MQKATLMERFAAEALGTFLLVFIGCGAAASALIVVHGFGRVLAPSDLLLVALAFGLALFIAIVIVGRVSGAHVNPAVTVGLAASGHFPWAEVPYYVGAQVLGAIVGAACIPIVYGRAAATFGSLGAPSLSIGTNLIQGLIAEAIGTAILVLTISAAAVDTRAPAGWAGLAIGLALAAIIMIIGVATGGSVNPARAFGPDLVNLFFGVKVSWGAFIVAYLIGPLLGGVAGAVLYTAIARLPVPKRPEREVSMPTADLPYDAGNPTHATT
jgi:glycerol uptake facilitator protein